MEAASQASLAKLQAWKDAHPDHARDRARRRRQDADYMELERGRARERYRANREKELARQAAIRATPERKAYRAAWRAANRERERETARARRIERLDRAREWARQNARRRRLGYDEATISYADVLALDPCSYCGAAAEHLDHIVPIAAGGANAWENLTAACGPCNRSKNAEPLLVALLTRL